MNLSQLIQESSGKASNSRLVNLAAWLVILGVWAWTSVQSGTLQELPSTILGLLGVSSGAKLWQKNLEVASGRDSK